MMSTPSEAPRKRRPIYFGEIRLKDLTIKATDLSTGEEQVLTTRPGSTCHFFAQFDVAGYLVQLRLDRSDIDSNGRPRLDADIIDPTTGNHIRSRTAKSVHHTDSSGSNPGNYRWQFKDVDLNIQVSVEVRQLLSLTTHVKTSFTARVFRADGTVEEYS